MEGRGRWFPDWGNRLPRVNFAPKRASEGAELRRGPPSEVLPLRSFAIPPDRRSRRRAGPMVPGFRSVADPSDRHRSRNRGHPRTRGHVLRLLDGSNPPKDALPPSSARSWPRKALIGFNGRKCPIIGEPPVANHRRLPQKAWTVSSCPASCSNLTNHRQGARKPQGCQRTTKRGVVRAEEVGKRSDNEAMPGSKERRAVQRR